MEVTTDTSAKAHDIQLNSQSFLEKHVFDVVEEYIARIEEQTKDWTVQLEKIELDVTLLKGTLGEVEMKEAVERQLDAIFSPILQNIEENNTEGSSEVKYTPSESFSDAPTPKEAQRISVLTPQARQRKSILHFIRTGKMPWWVTSHDQMRKMLQDKEILSALEESDTGFLMELREVLKKPLVRRRLIRQFSIEVIVVMIERIASVKSPLMGDLMEATTSKEFIAIINTASPTEKMEFIDVLLVSSVVGTSKEAVLEKWSKVLLKKALRASKEVTSYLDQQLPDFVKTLSDITEIESPVSQNQSEKLDIEETSDLGKDSFDTLLVENAGLVILSPFLKPLLSTLELLEEDGTLKDPILTAHILHYLATGEEEDFEFALIFEAFLCGISIREPLPKSVPLTDEIKNECHEVLASVLEHWTALKSSSIPLLQQSFLQRQGKLMLNEEAPRIIVERSGVDILLDKIPWSIGILKLPWHDTMTYVEW